MKINLSIRSSILCTALIISLLGVSACSSSPETPTDQTESAAITSENADNTTSAAVSEKTAPPSQGDEYKNTFLDEDITRCIDLTGQSDGFDLSAYQYDVDFDGNNEVIIPILGGVDVFKKTDNELIKSHTDFPHYFLTDDLKTMQTYDKDGEKYAYFYDKYEGTMECYVLISVRYDSESNSYVFKNELSWGRVPYTYDGETKYKAFFANDWVQNPRTMSGEDYALSREDFLDIYNMYDNLPAWDMFLENAD